MKGVAIADAHAGFTRHPVTVGGRNARSVDVDQALQHAAAIVVEEQPDIVTFAGDQFDHTRPSNHSLVAFQDALLRIVRETEADVVIIPGNHCGTRTVEALTPNAVIERLHERIHVVDTVRRLVVQAPRSGERCAIDCFPFGVLNGEGAYDPTPDPGADVSMMLIHAAVRSSAAPDAVPHFYAGDDKVDVGPYADRYDVIAAGDFHTFTRLHPTKLAFYSGSLERVSSDIWKEREPKGLVVYDTATGDLRFREVPTRPMFDFRIGDLLDYDVATAEMDIVHQTNAALRALTVLPLEGKPLVRLRVDEFPREDRNLIDLKAVRQLRERCLHFHLDVRYREQAMRDLQIRRDSLSRSLDEEAATFFAEEPEDVRALALEFLSKAGAS